jgi:hypothetical protein
VGILVGRYSIHLARLMKKHTQVYTQEQDLITDIKIEDPNIWTLLNKDNMTNALAFSLVILVISLCYSAVRQPTTSAVSDNPVQLKVGEYDINQKQP